VCGQTEDIDDLSYARFLWCWRGSQHGYGAKGWDMGLEASEFEKIKNTTALPGKSQQGRTHSKEKKEGTLHF